MPTLRSRAQPFLLPLLLLLGLASVAAAQSAVDGAVVPAARERLPDSFQDRVLVVGTKVVAPFSMQDADGNWSGISQELWRQIADSLGLRYELRELPLESLLDSVAAGRLDAVVGALTITPEREARMDFTHPFQVTGLAIAVHADASGGWMRVLSRFLSLKFLFLVVGLLAVLLLVGTLVWTFERHRNPEQFGGSVANGLGSSMWWGMVTMTTVGYGDLAPRTLGGRIVGLVWMFAALIMVSTFTASITASLTLGELQGPVQGPSDLSHVRVATVDGSTSAEYLTAHGVAFSSYPDALQALEALQNRTTDAVVYDDPIMRYLITEHNDWRIRVLPSIFERQYYGFALPTNSPLREPVNRLLLQIIDSAEWKRVVTRYTGE